MSSSNLIKYNPSKFDKHVESKLGKANKCFTCCKIFVEGGVQSAWVDYLFKTIVLPNVTYALVVYGASEPE